MNSPLLIQQSDELPTLNRLFKLLDEHESIEIRYDELPSGYIKELTYNLPDCAVYNRVWDKAVFISPSINNSKVLDKKTEFYECARAFRNDAINLMQEMSLKFGIDLNTLDGLTSLKFKKSNGQTGRLSEEWAYYLHGAECRFENTMTGQVVEVIIITKPEFGYLDCYFFYNYMVTTKRFKNLATWFNNDHHNICKAIDLLALEGILTRVPEVFIHRNVIAL